jgi:hypothetical protein
MTCQECELLLAGEDRSAVVDQHLAMCEACRVFELDLRANAEAMHAFVSEPMPMVARPKPVRWPYVAAAMAIAAILILMLAIPKKQQAPPTQIASIAAPFVIEQTPRALPVVHQARKRAVRHQEPRLLQVKMLTDDPNVVIYWQVETKGTE